MPALPAITGKEAKRAFMKLGWKKDRIRGSHHILKKAGHLYVLSIPIHGNRSLGTGLLRALIAASGQTEQEFLDAL